MDASVKVCDAVSDTPRQGGILMRGALTSVVLVIVLTLSGCLAVSVHGKPNRGHGPPPHAPAHGYRHHHQGATLAFDSKLGVYVVVGYPGHYYSEGRFLRVRAGTWQVSASLGGPWNSYSPASLPPGLRKPRPSKAKGHKGKGHRGKGHAPAKGRW